METLEKSGNLLKMLFGIIIVPLILKLLLNMIWDMEEEIMGRTEDA